MRQPRPGIVANAGKGRLYFGKLAAILVAQREAEHDPAPLDRVGQELVVVGHRLEARHQRVVGRDFLDTLDDPRRCCAVGIDQQDVESDRGGAQLVEAIDQPREQRPRPGPLAEALQAVVVDVDDADRGRLVLPRLQAQEFVEDIQAELHERPGLAEPGEEGGEQNRQWQDVMEVPVEVSAKRLHRVSFQPARPAALFLRRRRGLRRVMAARLAISPGARSPGP